MRAEKAEFVPPSFECQLANPTIVAFAFWPFVQIQGIRLPGKAEFPLFKEHAVGVSFRSGICL